MTSRRNPTTSARSRSIYKGQQVEDRRRPRRAARRLLLEQLESRRLLAIDFSGNPTWVEEGPGPTTGGQVEGLGGQSSPVTGAIEAVAPHPTNADIAYVATVDGGIWRTNNATNASPTWTPLTEQFPSLAISSIAFSPLDATNNTLFAGTGDWRSGSSVVGGQSGDGAIGVLRTTDGGATWQVIGTQLAGFRLRSVVPTSVNDPTTSQQVLLAAADDGGGVYRSTDGGVTFTLLSGVPASGLPAGSATHLVADPGNANRFYVGIPGQGVFLSTNTGQTWTPVNGSGATAIAGIGASTRIELSVSPAGTNPVYAALLSNGVVTGIFRSANQGGAWTTLDNPSTTETGNAFGLNPGGEKPGGQGRIHFSILADLTNANVVFVGGDRQPQANEGNQPIMWPNSIGCNDFSGRHFRINASQATGSQAAPLNCNGANGTSPHADSRDMVFDANGDILETDDGGIYRLQTPNTPGTRSWESVNGDIRVAQFYHVAYDNLNDTIIGGTQDTGTPEQNSAGNFTWRSQTLADGGDTAVDNSNANCVVVNPCTVHYFSTQNLGGFRRAEINNANTEVAQANIGLAIIGGGGLTLPGRRFIQPYELNVVDPSRMMIGTTFLYESADQGDTLRSLGGLTNLTGNGIDDDGDGMTDEGDEFAPANPVGTVNAIAYGGRQGGADQPDVVYVGTTGGTVNGVLGNLFLRTANNNNNLTDFTTLTTYTGATPRDIVLDPEDFRIAYIVDTSDRVWRTSDAGATAANWTELTGNLNGNPFISDLRTIELIPGAAATDPDVLVVGGLGGVFRSTVGINAWSQVGVNMPNVRAQELAYDAADDVLIAGTIGRGAWSLANAQTAVSTAGALTICGDEDYVNQDDVIRLERNVGNPALLDVFLNGTLMLTAPLASMETINVFGQGGNDELIIDTASGLINVPRGIHYDGDGSCTFDVPIIGHDRGFDKLTLIQSSGPVQSTSTVGIGATPGSGTHAITGPTGSQTVYFEELEPVVDSVPAATFTVTSVPGLASILGRSNTATYSASQILASGGRFTVDEFEPIEFSNKDAVTFDAKEGADIIDLSHLLTPDGLDILTINGGIGDDIINTRDGVSVGQLNLIGEAGHDLLDASGLTLIGTTSISGGNGNDTLIGHAGADSLLGGGGDDVLVRSAGTDFIDGGLGFDTILVYGTSANDAIDVFQASSTSLTTSVGGPSKTDTLAAGSIDELRVEALAGDDIIRMKTADGLRVGPAANVMRMDIHGGPNSVGDRLLVVDHDVDDLILHQIGAASDTGVVTVGPANTVPFLNVFDGVEFVQFVDDLGVALPNQNVVVFKHDLFEFNNTRNTAAHLGGGAVINVDPVINPGGIPSPFGDAQGFPGDTDWFQLVAAETGTLDVQVHFEGVATLASGRPGLPGDGRLTVRILDASGDEMATVVAATSTARIAAPIVHNQVYFVEVSGASAPAINAYDMTLINVPAPIPELVDLQALSDSGRHDNDDVTREASPTFDIVLDDDRVDEFTFLNLIPDATNDDVFSANTDYVVEVFNNGVSIGFAFYTGAGNTWRFTAGAGDLVEGHNNFIAAAVRIRDRAIPAITGRGELSPALRVTLDTTPPAAPTILIDPAASDTGVDSFPATIADRITSSTATGFVGNAEADSIVRMYAGGALPVAATFGGVGTTSTQLAFQPLLADNFVPVDVSIPYLLSGQAISGDGAGGLFNPANKQYFGFASYDIDHLLIDPRHVFKTPGATDTYLAAPLNPGDTQIVLQNAAGWHNGATSHQRTFAWYGYQDSTGFVYPNFTYTRHVLANAWNVGGIVGNVINLASPWGGPALPAGMAVRNSSSGGTFSYSPLQDLPVPNVLTTYSGVISGVQQNGEQTANKFRPGTAFIKPILLRNYHGAADNLITWQDVTVTADIYQGLTVALPEDGNRAFPEGQWNLAGRYDLNDPSVGFPLDGLRPITVNAEDLAGNVSENTLLNVFIDTQGPQITSVYITDDPATVKNEAAYDLFDPKPSTDGPTPLVKSLSINVRDLPARHALFLYEALFEQVAEVPGHYHVVGDHNGEIAIASVSYGGDPIVAGQPATGVIKLTFVQPLPDDRFTLTIDDGLVDPAGNRLDGESNAPQPLEIPLFPSGDRSPGGDFVARFTVDTRPEIGSWAAGSVYIDTNGNNVFDAEGKDNDDVNEDIVYLLGTPADLVFAGNFVQAAGGTADGFDKLAAYGKVGANFRWLIDVNNDGVPDISLVDPAQVNGRPAAGNFDNNGANGDEVVLFDGTKWYFDTNHDFKVDLPGIATPGLVGFPIVGDFDGDGKDDLATWTDDFFAFDLAFNGFGGATADATINLGGFPVGVRERPVAADMDHDGIDDLGLWVPDRSGQTPSEGSEWYFLVSNDPTKANRVTGSVVTLNHAFKPQPFGADLFAQYGDEFALPVIGNFDPPVTASGEVNGAILTHPENPLDVNSDGEVSPIDALLVINHLNASGSGSLAGMAYTGYYIDVSHDGMASPIDVALVINQLNFQAQASSESPDRFELDTASPRSSAVPTSGRTEVEVLVPLTVRLAAVDALFSNQDVDNLQGSAPSASEFGRYVPESGQRGESVRRGVGRQASRQSATPITAVSTAAALNTFHDHLTPGAKSNTDPNSKWFDDKTYWDSREALELHDELARDVYGGWERLR